MHDFLKDGASTVTETVYHKLGTFLAHSDDENGDVMLLTLTREHAEQAAQERLKDDTAKWEDYFRIISLTFMGTMMFAVRVNEPKK